MVGEALSHVAVSTALGTMQQSISMVSQDHGVCRNTANVTPCDLEQIPADRTHEHATPAPITHSFRSATDDNTHTSDPN